MSVVEDHSFVRHGIVSVEHSDGRRTAQEMIVRRSANGDLEVSPVHGTERALPISREEAEQWVSAVADGMPEDVRQRQIEMLCGSQ